MGPPADATSMAHSPLSSSILESNGSQRQWSDEAQKGRVEGASGTGLPLLPVVAHEEILQLMTEYCEARGWKFVVKKTGQKGVEGATGSEGLTVKENGAMPKSKVSEGVAQNGDLVLGGKWAEVLHGLEAFQGQLGPQYPSLVALVKKQQLMELMAAHSSEGAAVSPPVETVTECLEALRELVSVQEFEALRECASASSLQEQPAYANWAVGSSRQEAALAIQHALDTALSPPLLPEPIPAPLVSTETRLEVLLQQALAFQACKAGFSIESAERLSRGGFSTSTGEVAHLAVPGGPNSSVSRGVGAMLGLEIDVGALHEIDTSSAGSSLESSGLYTPPGVEGGGVNGVVLAELSMTLPSVNEHSSGETTPQQGVEFTLLKDVDWSPAGQPDPFEVRTAPEAHVRRSYMEDSLLVQPLSAGVSRTTSIGGLDTMVGDLTLPVVPRVKARVNSDVRTSEEKVALQGGAHPERKPMNGTTEREGGWREGDLQERGSKTSLREGVERQELPKHSSKAKLGGEELEPGLSCRALGPDSKPETKSRRGSPPLEERNGPTVVVTSKPPRAAKTPGEAPGAKPSPAASPRIHELVRGSAPPSPIKSKGGAQWAGEEGGGSRKGTPKGSWSNPPSPHGEGVDPDEYDKDVRAQYEQVKALFEAEKAAKGDYRGERYEEVGAKYELGKEQKGASVERVSRVHSRGHLSGELDPMRIRASIGNERVPSPRPVKTSPRKPAKPLDYGSPSVSPSKHRRSSSAEKLHEAAEKVPLPRAERLEKPISRSGPLDRIASSLSMSRTATSTSAASTPKGLTRSPSFIRRASAAGRSYGTLDPTAGFASATVLKDTQPVRTVAWDRDGNFLAVGSNSRTLRICHVWGVTGEEPGSRSSREHAKAGVPGAKVVVEERDWHMGSVYTVGWNCTGGLMATGSNDQVLKVASVQRAKGEDYGNLYFGIAGPDDIGECAFEGHDGTIRDLAFSPVAENMVLSGGAGDFGMRYWDCESGTCVATLWGSTAAIFAMRIAPDGRTVVTGGGESNCRVWDLRTASCVRTFGQYNAQVSSLALGWESPGGPQVIAGFADGTCRVVDFGTGKDTRKLTHHTADCRSVDVSPGGRWLLTGGFDGSIGIVDARTGWRVAGVYRAHGDKVIQSRWHPGGVGFATSSADRTVRVWAAAKPSDDGD